MKAVLCKTLDGFEAAEVVDIAEPTPGVGEVRVAVSAVGLNFADTLISRGAYQFKPDLPFSPGAELAGRVDALAPGVTGINDGQRVLAYINWGAAREKACVPATALVPVPDAIDDETAAGLSVTYGTAMHGLIDRGRCKAGDTVVVTGAAGGAGLAAVEVATRLGARVIAVASSTDKIEVARGAGASDGIVFPGAMSGSDLKQAVRDLTDGKGCDIVYDCIGGEVAEPLVRSLAWQGRFLVVGFAAGDIPRIPLNLLLLKGADIAGVFWGEFVRREPQRHGDNMRRVMQWIEEGKLSPRIHGVYPLSQFHKALGIIARREATGKVVLKL